MCYKMKHIALGMLLVTMAVFSSKAQAVVISFEQNEGFPTPGNSFAGMAVPSGIVDNWTTPTGSNLLIDDGPGGLVYQDAPAPITGNQEAAIDGPDNQDSVVVMDLKDSANLNMGSFYWAYRGNGNSRCESEGYGAQTAFLDVKYYDLSGALLGTDTFCGGLNPDWTPKWTLATPSASYQNVPLSKIEFRGRAPGLPRASFFLEDITLVPVIKPETVLISFEQSEGFPTPCNSFSGMAVPSGIVDNWTAPTGSQLLMDDGPGGCGFTDIPAPITGTQEAVVFGPDNVNSTVVMDLKNSANLSMTSFYWAYRGQGDTKCGAVSYPVYLDVKYYDLKENLLGTDRFCGGLNPDWTPKWTLATPSASYQNIPLSKVEFIGNAADSGMPTPWHATFLLEDITLVYMGVLISYEQSEGFPTPGNSFAGMAVPSGIVDNWTAPTGSNLLIEDGPGGIGYSDAPAPITGSQEAVVEGPDNVNSSVIMDLNNGAYLSMSSFYWAYRGNGDTKCGSVSYPVRLDVKYYDLNETLLGTDTFCGGLAPDWSPLWTVATPSVSYRVPLSKVEFIGNATGSGLPTPWRTTFFLENISLVPLYPASTTTSLTSDLSMNQYKLKGGGDIITKGPWVDARAYNNGVLNDVTINAAITAIGTDKKTLLLAPGTWTIAANVTVPTNINIRFEEGAILSIGSGYTFTINGPIDAPIVQIFTGSGSGKFGAGYVKEVYPQWWGAKGDGITDDTAAIQAAIDSGCKRVCFIRPSSIAYILKNTGLTIASGTSNLSLVGINERGNIQLRYLPTTGNGITFNGEADNFTMENIYLRSENSSSGAAIFSNNLSSAPLRDMILKDVEIAYFKTGVLVQGGQNIKIIGGHITGAGKAVVGSIGVQLGEDATHACTQGLIYQGYVTAYETGIYNKYCDILHIRDAVTATSGVALKIAPNKIVYIEDLFSDQWNDTAIYNDGGYVYYSGIFSSGTQYITDTGHRTFREGSWLTRVNVYRNTSTQSIPTGTATKLQLNAEREDWDNNFDPTTNYRFTATYSGYYMVATMVQWRAGTTNKQYKTMIYRNGAMLTEHIDYSRGTVPYYFSVPYSTMVWLDKDDYIEVYVQHNEGVNSQVNFGNDKTYLVIADKP